MHRFITIIITVLTLSFTACQTTLPNDCVINANIAREKLYKQHIWAEVIKVTFTDQREEHAFTLYDVGKKDSYGYGVFNNDFFSRKLYYRTHNPQDATWQLYGPKAKGEFLDSELREANQ